jgi:FolB domain-containing protein
MADRLVIERLEFEGFVGIDESERTTPQPLAADLELFLDLSKAISTDELQNTVDYAVVAKKVVAAAQQEQFCLIETLGERLAEVILEDSNIGELRLWVRKLRPPLKITVGSVGVRIARGSRSGQHSQNESASWLVDHRNLLQPGRALDLASGEGRNALYLAQQGFEVHAWDRNQDSLQALAAKAASLHLPITTRLVDLEREPSIPVETFDLIVVFHYLQRDLIPAIIKSLRPGGIVIYETFLIDNHERFNHPRRREFCLGHNELLSLFSELRILAYREGARTEHPPFLASLVAQRSA